MLWLPEKFITAFVHNDFSVYIANPLRAAFSVHSQTPVNPSRNPMLHILERKIL